MNNSLLIARSYVQNLNVDETYFVNNLVKTLSYLDEETQLNFIATLYGLAPVLEPGTKVQVRDTYKGDTNPAVVVEHNPVLNSAILKYTTERWAKQDDENPTFKSTNSREAGDYVRKVIVSNTVSVRMEYVTVEEEQTSVTVEW